MLPFKTQGCCSGRIRQHLFSTDWSLSWYNVLQQHDGVHHIHWGKRWGSCSNMMGFITYTGVRDGVPTAT